ncbi:acrylyl-CoA reductase (NADPH) [Azospirillum brasilense]|nr:acrylyl-CoA reductase (NADPH) [Azospirillum brasilense]
MPENFTAFVIEDVGGKPKGGFTTLTLADLPDNDVLVEVACSTLNYKDGLAVSGKGRIARKLPMVAGIDLAGTVVESRSPAWKPGDKVVANGWGLSETQWGGYTRFQRLKAEWLTRLPDAFSFEEAMGIGTAGYTAALCVDALERWGALRPGGKEVLVTGAAGPKRTTICVAWGPPASSTAPPFWKREPPCRRSAGPAVSTRWAGRRWSTRCRRPRGGGAIAACGLAGSSDLPGTVLPHILRGVALLGVDSVMAPPDRRDAAWTRLARDLDRNALTTMYEVQPFGALPELATKILAGTIRGRIVIDVTR